jgi:acetoin utilization deacetylase AcuC-like enzyme
VIRFRRLFELTSDVDRRRFAEASELFRAALPHVVRVFAPRFLVLSIGFDIMRGDPAGSFALTAQGMQRIGRRIGRIGLPTLIVQEGGYSIGNLRSGFHAFFTGVESAWHG